jgi:hypothetical protein
MLFIFSGSRPYIIDYHRFKWLKEPEVLVVFSNAANRMFCNQCGTSLKWEGFDSVNEAEINAMTLDELSSFSVDAEIYMLT